MEDLGPPIAYTVLEEGTPVYDRDGKRIGVVEHVVADMQLDIFEGVIVHTRPLPGSHLFADVDQIAELHERGVLLSVGRDDLHEPPDEAEVASAEDRDDKTGRARSRPGCAAPGTGSRSAAERLSESLKMEQAPDKNVEGPLSNPKERATGVHRQRTGPSVLPLSVSEALRSP